jgi:hypothetical protein
MAAPNKYQNVLGEWNAGSGIDMLRLRLLYCLKSSMSLYIQYPFIVEFDFEFTSRSNRANVRTD